MDFRTGKITGNKPLVTVAISSYNYSNYITAALNSVLNQTYDNIEVIIVDDKSKDNCATLIQNWITANNLHCKFIINHENIGITKVSNKLLSLATGKYISFFATDDEMLPQKIEQQVAALESRGIEFSMCYANPLAFDEEGNDLGTFVPANSFKPQNGCIIKAWLQKEIVLVPPACLIKTSVYSITGTYDERVLFEDYNFWLRLLSVSKAVYCEYPCLKYRVKKVSTILNKWNHNKQERYFHDRILSHQLAMPFIKNAEVRKMIQKKTIQYLKAMADNKSSYLKQDIWLLLTKGYFKIPIKVLIKAVLN